MDFKQLNWIAAFCLIWFGLLFAHQKGVVEGYVRDFQTHQPLVGAEIELVGKYLGTVSDSSGYFYLADLAPGEYRVRVTYLGYLSSEMPVKVRPGEVVRLEFNLKPRPLALGKILVEAEKVYSAASSRAVRRFDIKVRPTRSAQDMLQMAPGLFIAQHAGGGKAEQIFLRGFDCDHGTDVAIDVDGIPVNMVTHGHGQGYADLHFLIPEVVEAIDVYKGPYFAPYGNLATAGAVSFTTKDHLEHNRVSLELGSFNTRRLTGLFRIPHLGAEQNGYLAAQFYRTDGPFESPQDFNRFNLFGKFHQHFSARSKLTFSFGTFGSAWNASGQIPQRAVDRGLITRWGAIDDLEGGTTGRQNVNLVYSLRDDASRALRIQAYASRYNFKLFSNFTLFLKDTLNGDMIEQFDNRQLVGMNAFYKFSAPWGRFFRTTTFAGGFRQDNIHVGLWKAPGRQRVQAWVDNRVVEQNLYFWYREEVVFSSFFRMQLGLRGDYFTFDVDDRLDDPAVADSSGLPRASGYAQKAILSPKVNLVFSPTSTVDIFVNAGSGFHSNDARDVVISQKMHDLTKYYREKGYSEAEIAAQLRRRHFDPAQRDIEFLPRAVGAELGLRTRLFGRLNLGLAAWWLDLQEELVYVGDEGSTEISGPTRRMGLDVEVRLMLAPYLWFDSDLNLARARYKDLPDGENEIPLAPRFTSTGGLTLLHPNGWEGSLRYRFITDRPANETNTVVAKGYTVVDATLGYRFGDLKLVVMAENLFNVEWNEAQFDTESRLPGEKEPVSEIHFTPGNPRNVRLGISYRF